VLIDSTGADHAAPPHLVASISPGSAGPALSRLQEQRRRLPCAGGLRATDRPGEGPPLTLPDYQSAIMGGLAAFIPAMASLLGRQSRRYE